MQQAHFAYSSSISPDDDDEINEWIDEMTARFDAAEIEADRSIEAHKRKLSSLEDNKPAVQAKTIRNQHPD